MKTTYIATFFFNRLRKNGTSFVGKVIEKNTLPDIVGNIAEQLANIC
jgi:hypothetical protein